MRLTVRGTAVSALAIAALAGGGWLAFRWEGEAPAVTFPKELKAIGRPVSWSFAAEDRRSGLRELRAWVRQGDRTSPLFSEEYPDRGTRRREATVTVDPKALGLAEGRATIIVAARDRSLKNFKGNSVFREVPLVVDTKPPRLDVPGAWHYVNRGGAGVVLYKVDEAPEASGVDVDGRFFPGYPEKGRGDGTWAAFFAVPHDAPAAPRIALVARDAAGNEVRRGFPVRLLEKAFPGDTIEISDRFLEAKIPEFRAADPGLPADPVQAFLAVNRDWRARDHARIREICAKGSAERRWEGAFLQMPNTKNMAGWAERRTYTHGGRVIDSQTHLGIDLASTAGAPVPAANAGVVAFAGDLGIYGGAVILDHGQGLFSLYGHLGGIGVTAGQEVAKGAAVGASGQTGMAGGDHLHFSMLVSGTFVSPAEWLDAHWIADNVQGALASF